MQSLADHLALSFVPKLLFFTQTSTFDWSGSSQSCNNNQTKRFTFQRWISWFPQRWRTPRNAICNVNCRIKWIIKSLNANCCSSSCGPSMPASDSFYKRTNTGRCSNQDRLKSWSRFFRFVNKSHRGTNPLRCANLHKNEKSNLSLT